MISPIKQQAKVVDGQFSEVGDTTGQMSYELMLNHSRSQKKVKQD